MVEPEAEGRCHLWCGRCSLRRGAAAIRGVIGRRLLPSTLHKQLDLIDNRVLFLRVPFLKNCDATCASHLVAGIQRLWAWPETSLIDEGSTRAYGFFLVNTSPPTWPP